ncbi:SUMF1/EgtB/PvdO family nonheme iron enzyme [Chloroflexota bacterium]
MPETIICPHCSSENQAGASFCASCGNSLADAPAQVSDSVPPAQQPDTKPRSWIWIVGVIAICLVCLVLTVVLYFTGDSIIARVSNLFATATPTPTNTPTPTPTFTPTPTLGIGSTNIRVKDGMLELYVPTGSFLMGSESGDSDESPVHQVTLDAFWIDQTEVTVRMYRECVDAGVCPEPQNTSSATHSNFFYNNAFDNYPVIEVTWYNAVDYCAWVGARLPTEAEWEKAARGDQQLKYPWGNTSPTNQHANFGDNLGDVDVVGSYPMGASPYGALDMAGNAYEWVSDFYSSSYYDESPSYNPTGPSSGSRHTLRSASFNTSSSTIRAANRGSYPPGTTGDDDGFRCARDASQP